MQKNNRSHEGSGYHNARLLRIHLNFPPGVAPGVSPTHQPEPVCPVLRLFYAVSRVPHGTAESDGLR